MGPDQPYDAPRAGPPGEPDVLAAGPRHCRTWTRGSRVLAALAVLLVAAGLLTWAWTGARRTPERSRQAATDAVSGALLGFDYGGTTWHNIRIPRAGAVERVPSAAVGTAAALLGSERVTWLPFDAAVRVEHGRAQLLRQPAGPRMFVDWALVLPGGRLLVDVVAWSSDRNGDHVGTVGPFVSRGRDWRHWLPLRPGRRSGLAPAVRRSVRAGHLRVVGATVRVGSATVLVAAARHQVFAVEGGTWTPVPY